MIQTNSDGRIQHAGAVQDALRCRRPGPVDPHIIADAPHLQLDIATLPRPERGTIERQFEGADIDAIPRDQGLGAAHELAVDVGAVRAAEVAHHDRTTRYFEFGVTARNIWMIQHDLAGHRLTADCQAVVERQAIGQGHGGRQGRRRDKIIDRAAIGPAGAEQSPHLPHGQHRPLDDGDAVISPQASVRWSPAGGMPLLLPNTPADPQPASHRRAHCRRVRPRHDGRPLPPKVSAAAVCRCSELHTGRVLHAAAGQPKARRRAGSRQAAH